MICISKLILTRHAQTRLQQRGIPESAIDKLIKFGTRHHAGQSCFAYHMDRRALVSAQKAGERIERFKDIACIVADDAVVVTVEHARRKPKHWNKGGRR